MNFSDSIPVCIVTPSLYTGGAEIWFRSLIRYFDPRRVRVLYVAAECESCVSPLMRESLLRYTKIRYGQSAIDEADAFGCLFLCWGINGKIFNFEGVSNPIVNVLHGANPKCDWTQERLQWAMSAKAHLVAVNEACLQVVPQEARSKFTIIENGADIERVVPRASKASVMAKYGIREGDKLVAHIGRISPDKGLPNLVAAAEKLPSEWRLLLCGPRDPWNEPVGEWQTRLQDRMILADPVDHVGDVLQVCDVFALLSPSEAHPLAVTEAWLAGVPTVATQLPCYEALEKKYGPLIIQVDPSDSQMVAHHIAVTGRESHMAKNARKVAWENFTSPAMAWRYEEYFRKIMGRAA